jgi:hypothetical protein
MPVVECQVPPHFLMGGTDAVIGPQVHFLVLHAPPQLFPGHIITPVASVVHANLDARVFQQSRELLASKWAALIRIEAVRIAIADQGLLDHLDAEVGRPRVGQPTRGDWPSPSRRTDTHSPAPWEGT